jgi:hypothetical protein
VPAEERPTIVLRRLIDGHKVTQAIAAAVELGLPDLIADGARAAGELAATTGTDPPSLVRLLRALVAVGILEEREAGTYALTDVGAGLRSDAAEPLAGWALFCGSEAHQRVWRALLHSVRTGDSAFAEVHGAGAWEYRASHPEAAAVFDRAMTDLSRRSNRALLEAYDFGRFSTIVDVGGGRGAFLAAMLDAHQHLQGVLFDLPHVIATAPALDPARWRAEAGSFFEGVPAGGDAYVLRAVLHDWGDDDCVRILRVCRAAMGDGATLLVVERAVGDGLEETTMSDLNMLVGPGGRERAAGEYRALFERAGFRMTGDAPSAVGLHVFQATPA